MGKKRKCSFCQKSTKMTLEHVLPNWLCDLYPEESKVTNQFVGENYKKEWTTNIFQHKAKVVCSSCNNGWMSSLESETKPILSSLLNMEQFHLDEKQQEILAFWVQKTVLMLNKATPNSLQTTQDLFDELYEKKSPSKKVLVNIGWRIDGGNGKKSPLASFQILQVPSVRVQKDIAQEVDEQKNSGGFVWKAVLAIGRVVFELVGHNMNIVLDVNINSKVFETIQPYSKSISWPLEWPLEVEGGLEAIKSRI